MKKRGFTYIELLIALTIIAVLFLPVMQLFSHSLTAVGDSQDLITATNLAKAEMERMRNLRLTKEQLRQEGTVWYPDDKQEPLMMNQVAWRIQREVMNDTDPLEVRVNVFYDQQKDKPVISLVTLIEDTFWEEVKPAI